jgi:hypothetical protein
MHPSSAKGALALLLAHTTGCSLVFVKGPPVHPVGPADASLACTTSRAAPIADVVAGGVASVLGLGLLVGSGASASCAGFGCVGSEAARESARAVGPVLLAAGLVGVLSGVVGFQRTSECRAAGAMRLPQAATWRPTQDRLPLRPSEPGAGTDRRLDLRPSGPLSAAQGP